METTHETVVVRDHDGVRQTAKIDDWTSMVFLAALSVDPLNYDELLRACLRYRPDNALAELAWSDDRREPSGPWVLLDLPCRRISAGGGAALPDGPGCFRFDESDPPPEMLWLNIPPMWKQETSVHWSDAFPPLPPLHEPLDVRGVLFGRPLAEGIAKRILAAASSEPLPAKHLSWEDCLRAPSDADKAILNRWHELSVRVHADWLMTPHAELAGETPRQQLHRHREWIETEIDNRRKQWMRENGPPRPLDRDTFAYRFGPIGTNEMTVYFKLCRRMIDAAWKQIVHCPGVEESMLTEQLYAYVQWWLVEGEPDEPPPPKTIIDEERRRVPLVDDGSHLDCDCPLCRMMADSSSPVFIYFDGVMLEMDDEFAFSSYESREEWRLERMAFDDYESPPASEMNLVAEVGSGSGSPTEEAGGIWTNSFVAESSPATTLSLAVRLTELVGHLQMQGADRAVIEQLNASFDDYRAAVGDPKLSAATATHFREALERVAEEHPTLTSQAADLQSHLDECERTRSSA